MTSLRFALGLFGFLFAVWAVITAASWAALGAEDGQAVAWAFGGYCFAVFIMFSFLVKLFEDD